MKNYKGIEKKIYTGLMAFVLMIGAITLTVTTSYAYFVAKFSIVNPENSNSNFTSANITATYSDGDAISLTNAIPGTSTAVKTIKFTNTGTVPLSYRINWKTITNTGITGLKYTISCSDTATIGTGTNLEMPDSPDTLISGTLTAGNSNTCQLQVHYTDTDLDQSQEMSKTFSASLEAVAAATK